jgi:dienelactone hydrolase
VPRVAPCVLTILALLASASAACGEDLNVPPGKIEGGSPGNMMHRYLMTQVEQAVRRWKADYEKRKTPEQIAAYQKRLHDEFLKAIGGLPERTPLEPRVVGTISRPGYRVEKVIFQSQPKHYVTALMFLPDPERFKPPYPGVLVPCGHGIPGKAYPSYQAMGTLLALNGMAGLVFDPIDQGERGQYLGEGGWPKLAGCAGHAMLGPGSILLGRNVARFEIWDGMRAIDYLQSRSEINPRRIGCTGSSGGGTQTAYLMALDDRIGAAVPSCYLSTTWGFLWSMGPDDAEQQLYGQLAVGLDEADFVMMRAPSPVLIEEVTQEPIDIAGTWEMLRYAKRLYTRMGYAERVDIIEYDAMHAFHPALREASARWMSRWLLGKDQVIVEPKINLLTEQECRCLPDGKVMAIPGARSAYDLNEDYENELAQRRKSSWASGDRTALLEQVRQLAGIRQLAQLPKPKVETVGTVARTGYSIKKLVISPEEGISLPALLFLPRKPTTGQAVLYLNENGKAADAAPGGPIERRVRAGDTVLAVDLRGVGQTKSINKGWNPPDQSSSKGWNPPEVNDEYLAYLLGRSCLGMRAEDVLVCARYIAERTADGREGSVQLVAIGNAGVPSLHAAALEPSLFQSVKLSRTLASWSNVVHIPLHKGPVVNFVHGALLHYDLPDLAATLGGKLTVEQPIDAAGGNGRANLAKKAWPGRATLAGARPGSGPCQVQGSG